MTNTDVLRKPAAFYKTVILMLIAFFFGVLTSFGITQYADHLGELKQNKIAEISTTQETLEIALANLNAAADLAKSKLPQTIIPDQNNGDLSVRQEHMDMFHNHMIRLLYQSLASYRKIDHKFNPRFDEELQSSVYDLITKIDKIYAIANRQVPKELLTSEDIDKNSLRRIRTDILNELSFIISQIGYLKYLKAQERLAL